MKILLTGATGFVGGRLLTELISRGHSVHCLVRETSETGGFEDQPGVEIFRGDARDCDSVRAALAGCDAAYYLIHSMGRKTDFETRDRQLAETFVAASADSSLRRLIYVSGLANEDAPDLSTHLASRLEVGRILRGGTVPCLELRAAMIIGKRSLSFRMVQHLCHRLPIMICPRWLSTLTQPLAIDDLLRYLVDSLAVPLPHSRVVEIGGRDRVTYLEILKEYCRQKNLRRWMIPLPILSTTLSSYWLALVTPETADVGKQMIDGLRNPTYVRTDDARQLFDIEPLGIAESIAAAIESSSDPSDRAPTRRTRPASLSHAVQTPPH